MPTQRIEQQQEVNDYFESSSEYWKEIYFDDRLLPTIYKDRLNTTLDWISKLGLRADARILEVGCGSGQLTVALAQSGHTVDAMDSTPAMLRMTRAGAMLRGVEDQI